MTRSRIVLSAAALLVVLWFWIGRERPSVHEGKESVGISSASSSQKSVNHPPVVTMVEIVPATPDRKTVLTARFETEDPDHDPVTVKYQWFVDGSHVGDQPILALNDFRQGDLVTVEITPSDGTASGKPMESPPVKIVNNPPVVKSIRLSPSEPKAGQEISVEAEGVDPDDDPIRYQYEWQVNGKPVDGNDGNVLDGAFVHSADKIVVMVIPSDSFSEGKSKLSQVIAVQNQPPEITSSPPAGMQGDQYTYQMTAKDSDGDTITYRLLEGPSGMKLDPTSGLLEWKAAYLPDGKANVVVRVEDGKGGKSIQQFVIRTSS